MAPAKRRRRRGRARREPRDELAARVRAAARSQPGSDTLEDRDAVVAMIVVRAIDRAKELTAVEGAGLALRRALIAAEKPMAAYVDRHLAKERRARRKKA